MHQQHLVGFSRIQYLVLNFFRFLSPRVKISLGDFFHFVGFAELSLELYKASIALRPSTIPSRAYQRIGANLGAKSKYILSGYYIKRSLKIDPFNTHALTNLGQLLYAKGDLDGAIFALHKAESITPFNHKTLYHLAYTYYLKQNYSKSRDYLKSCHRIKKRFLPAIELLANLSERMGDPDGMLLATKKVIQLEPTNWRARLTLGKIKLEFFSAEEAIEDMLLADAIEPSNSTILIELGKAYKKLSNFELSDFYLTKCLDSKGDSDYQTNLDHGRAYIEKECYDKAVELLSEARRLDPASINAKFFHGHALLQSYNYTIAINTLEEIVSTEPNNFSSLSNLGQAYSETGNASLAIAYLKKALLLRSDDPSSHWNLALSLLAAQEYEEGWIEYEWRWKINSVIATRERNLTFNNPQWDQNTPISGNLYILPEQGLGDVIQFVRYIEPLQQHLGENIKVCFFPGPKLEELISFSQACSHICSVEEATTGLNWIPLLSIPRILGINAANSNPKTPYLFARQDAITFWRDRFKEDGNIIIGIHWQGRVQTEVRGLQGRSLPLSTFETLAIDHDDIVLVSLQKGDGREQMNEISFRNRFTSYQTKISPILDFLETAAMVMACDLVITSDTALAHLSGALGQATWLLLPTNSDWRWGCQGSTTHWYPSMKLFRQSETGNWGSLMENVSDALKDWKRNNSQSSMSDYA